MSMCVCSYICHKYIECILFFVCMYGAIFCLFEFLVALILFCNVLYRINERRTLLCYSEKTRRKVIIWQQVKSCFIMYTYRSASLWSYVVGNDNIM